MFGGMQTTPGSSSFSQPNRLFSAAGTLPAAPATATVSFGQAPAAPGQSALFGGGSALFGGGTGQGNTAKVGLFASAPTSTAAPGGSTLFGASQSAGGLFSSGSTGGSLFTPTNSSSFLAGGATSSLLSGGNLSQQSAMVAPTNLFAPAVLAHQPAPPIADNSLLQQAASDPAGIFCSISRISPIAELTKPPEKTLIHRKSDTVATRPFAVPVEKWQPISVPRKTIHEKPAFCNLLDISPRLNCSGNERLASYSQWINRAPLQTPPSDLSDTVEIRIRGIPEGPIRLPRTSPVTCLQDRISKFAKGIDGKRVSVWYKGKILRSDETLSAVKSPAEMCYIVEEAGRDGFRDIADEKYIPTLTRPDYSTVPLLTDIARMSHAELQSVANFTIRNEHGSVEFPGKTDVSSLDLDAIVHIYKDAVVLYPEGSRRPRAGQGLNRKAKITLFHIFPRGGQSGEQFREKLKRICLKNKTNFHSYSEDTGEWVFTTNPEKV